MKSPNFQLSLQTSNLVIGFMVWVILSSLMPYIKADIPLTAGQISMVTAVPVILGSILRIPIGYWTNRSEQENCFLLVLFFYYSLSFTLTYQLYDGFNYWWIICRDRWCCLSHYQGHFFTEILPERDVTVL